MSSIYKVANLMKNGLGFLEDFMGRKEFALRQAQGPKSKV